MPFLFISFSFSYMMMLVTNVLRYTLYVIRICDVRLLWFANVISFRHWFSKVLTEFQINYLHYDYYCFQLQHLYFSRMANIYLYDIMFFFRWHVESPLMKTSSVISFIECFALDANWMTNIAIRNDDSFLHYYHNIHFEMRISTFII